MDVILSVLYGFGILFIGTAATVYWSNGNKTISLWMFIGGVIWIFLTAGFQAQRAITESAGSDKGASTNEAPKSDEAEIRQRRAYVLLDPDKIFETLTVSVGKEPEFMLRVKNVGQTPAYKLGVVRGSASGPWPLSTETDLTIKSTGEVRDISPPGNITFWGTNTDSKGNAVTQAQFDAFKTGALRFYIFGRITYRDIYDIDRYTNFCLSVVPPTDPQSAVGFGLQRCAHHNDSN